MILIFRALRLVKQRRSTKRVSISVTEHLKKIFKEGGEGAILGMLLVGFADRKYIFLKIDPDPWQPYSIFDVDAPGCKIPLIVKRIPLTDDSFLEILLQLFYGNVYSESNSLNQCCGGIFHHNKTQKI